MSIPAPDDLEGWKRIDVRVSQQSAETGWFRQRLGASHAVRRYFGHDDLEDMLERLEKQGVLPSYASWGILDYRPTATSQTRAEIMLAQGLSEADAMVLRARMAAYPSMYRVAEIDRRSCTITLENVLQGGSVTIHDKLMSGCVERDLFLIMRIFPAGNFWLGETAGPPLGAGQGAAAIDFLRELGMEFSPDGQRHDAHLFGRLWVWLDEQAENRQTPRICNMDGDDMLWHTASFSVSDHEQAMRALGQRDDIEADKDGMFCWVTKSGPSAKKMGGPVSLGHLEFVGDELIVTVNSAQRFAKARRWLEAIPGIAMQGVTTRQFNEPEENRPLDERISRPEPAEMTPDLSSAMQSFFDKHYMAWLDRSLPMLNGKTPREACRTPSGQQQVVMLIRTIPVPSGPAPIQVPREAMLRELGIPQQIASIVPAAQAVHKPTSRVGQYGNVSRNEPCPCGSGRKYKNCCGK